MAEDIEPTPIPPDTTGEPHKGKYVALYRVSTIKQGASGLGIDAQRETVKQYLNGGRWTMIAEFIEVESGSKKHRPQLDKAIALCLKEDATLLVAKIDRLWRDAEYTLAFMKTGVKFVACDMPNVCDMTIGLLAVIAQKERELVSQRTKEALQALKAKGKKLGAPAKALRAAGINGNEAKQYLAEQYAVNEVLPYIVKLRSVGVESLRDLADGLEKHGVKTRLGKTNWSAQTVKNVLKYEKAPEFQPANIKKQ